MQIQIKEKLDCIAAIATPLGNSGIGIIRISGADSLVLIDRIASCRGKILSEVPSHTIHYGWIIDGQSKQPIDEVLISVMRAPHTFTGDDTVEINCHGGSLITHRVLEEVLRAGAVPAEPGEFSKCAFLNGKMDLSKAEAIIDMIEAKNRLSMDNAIHQIRGAIKEQVHELRSNLLYEIAYIESVLDDPEHLQFIDRVEEFEAKLGFIEKTLADIVTKSEQGKMIKEGIRTAIIGKTNVGKSTLLNTLLGEERAIVTDIAGTTRDSIEESIRLGEIHLKLVDTAGIRETEDVVEKIGIKRSYSQIEEADLILYMLDVTRELDEDDLRLMEQLKGKNCIILLNKADSRTDFDTTPIKERLSHSIFAISARDQSGLEQLTEEINRLFHLDRLGIEDEIYITNLRQKLLFEKALQSVRMVRQSFEAGMPEDFYTIDLMAAYLALGEIIGETIGDDVVDEIFSKFCTGK